MINEDTKIANSVLQQHLLQGVQHYQGGPKHPRNHLSVDSFIKCIFDFITNARNQGFGCG